MGTGFLDMEGLVYYNQGLLKEIQKLLGIQIVSMSRDEYEALDEDDKMKDILYVVPDPESSELISAPQTMEADFAVEVDTSGAENLEPAETITWPSSTPNKSGTETVMSSFHITYKPRRKQ